MSQEALNIVSALLNIAVVVGATLATVPIIVVFERKIIGWAQQRPGPNRVGPWGLVQGLADGIKLFFKEALVQRGVDKALYYLAPVFSAAPAILLLSILPFTRPEVALDSDPILSWVAGMISALLGWVPFIGSYFAAPTGQETFRLTIASDLNVGLLFYFGITSISVFGVTLAGWASNNKYSLLGGIRSSAQMVSYELVLGLSAVGVLILAGGTLNLQEIIAAQTVGGLHAVQTDGWLSSFDVNLRHYNIWAQPIGFLLFLIGAFAETNRLPFDLPEAEAELTGGYHTEYSGIRFAMFFLAEYIHMIVVSSVITTLYLGGWTNPFGHGWESTHWITGVFWFSVKIAFFLFFFIFVRAVLPRLRFDQLMSFGWKFLLPVAVLNIAVTALAVPLFPKAHALVLFLINAAALWLHQGRQPASYLADERRREFRYVT